MVFLLDFIFVKKKNLKEKMGGQLSKGGVAVEGQSAAEPAAAKTNGQVSLVGGLKAASPSTWRTTPTWSFAVMVHL